VNAKLIIVYTSDGSTAKKISKLRAPC